MIIDTLSIHNQVNKDWKQSLVCIFFLVKAELLNLRLDWKWAILVVLINPLCMLFFLSAIMRENNETLIYIITGSMVMTLVTGTMLSLGQELGALKEIRGLDYYSVLPISKFSIIFALVTRTTIISIPSMLVLLLAGEWIFHVQLNINWSFAIIILFSGYSLSAIGAFIGLYSRDANQASVITQIIQPLVIFLSPVFIMPKDLPLFLNIISMVIPTRYVAEALRNSCQGIFDVKNVLFLMTFCIISILLIEKKLDWRE